MPDPKFLQSISFLNADDDSSLARYFTRTEAIDALADFRSPRVLAVGLKGVGKTAAFRYLTEIDDRADVVVAIEPHSHQVLLAPTELSFSACREQFEHDLVFEALRAIVAEGVKLRGRLGGDLLQRAQSMLSSYREALEGFAARLRGVTFFGVGFTVGDAPSKALVTLQRRSPVQEALGLLTEICDRGVSVRIVVDDPEQVLSAGRELDVHLLGGFFLAALLLARRIERLKIVALVKNFIYEPVKRAIADLDQYPELTVFLSWTRDGLVEMVSRRIESAGLTWDQVFGGSVNEAKKLVASEVCDGVRNGPRDLLRWLSIAAEESGNAGMTRTNFEATRRDLANFALDAVTASYHPVYEKLDEVILAIFRGAGGRQFKPGQFASFLTQKKRTGELKTLWRLNWMRPETPHSLPKLLFQVGSLALLAGGQLILPYQREYDLLHFRGADFVRLVPALAAAL